MLARIFCALILLAMTGCGRDEAEEQSIGLELTVQDQAFGLLEPGDSFVLSMVSRSGACDAAQAVSLMPEASALSVLLRKQDESPVDPGTYAVWLPGTSFPPGNVAFADFTRTDAVCQNELSPAEALALGGSVRLDEFDPSPGGRARGHYDLRFLGGTLSGDFDAVFCELPANFATAIPVCR